MLALCNTAIQFFDRHNNRRFLLLRIADFVVDAVNVVDVSVSEIVAFPTSEHLAFFGLTYTLGKSVSPLKNSKKVPDLSESSEESSADSSDDFCPSFCTNLPISVDAELIYRNHRAKEASRCFLHYRRIG